MCTFAYESIETPHCVTCEFATITVRAVLNVSFCTLQYISPPSPALCCSQSISPSEEKMHQSLNICIWIHVESYPLLDV